MRRSILAAALLLIGFAAEARSRAVRHPEPLVPSDIRSIMFAEFRPVQIRPGSTRQFSLQEYLGPGPFNFRPVQGIHIRWTVEGMWAGIDERGLLTVASEISPGSVLRVYANLDHGRRIISLPVYVYRAGRDPFLDAGYWRQTAEIPCDGSADLPVTRGIEELYFHASGMFTVTWQPFELYTDYWGPYTFNVARKKITFGVSGGNYMPDDIRGEGSFEIVPLAAPFPSSWGPNVQRSQLRLRDVYLGTKRDALPGAPKPCGMVFEGVIELP